MVNATDDTMREVLKIAFEYGHMNAISSLSRMTRNKIRYDNFLMDFHVLDSAYPAQVSCFNRQGPNLLLTTEVFGDVTGKSYLFISDTEFNLLTSGVPESKGAKMDLKEEFVKELDNILSASVITCLSNELKRKMYGDVPVLVGKVHGKIEDIIYDDFGEQASEIYLNSGHFSFHDHPNLRPLFIWVIDSSTLQFLQSKPE